MGDASTFFWLWFLSLCCFLGALSWLCCDKLCFLHFYLKVHKLSCQCHHPTFASWPSLTCTWPPSLFCAICNTQFPLKTPSFLISPQESHHGMFFLCSATWYVHNLKKKRKKWCLAECYSYKRLESFWTSCNCFMINTAQQTFEHTCATSGSPVKAKLVCLSYFTF